jgi:hypothetical protein
MSVDVEALQELAATEPRLDDWCCLCGAFSAISTVITCFGCTMSS